jgi:2-methylisocitrate lyase-like PEP mutase family enzyme
MSPVIFDVMSAKLAALRGFPTVFAGGMPTAASMFGIGDYGMVTISELIEFAGRIAEAVDIPVMADGDDLGGNPLNAYRAMRRYERAGVACVMLEDMTGAKHIPGLPEGPIVSQPAMVDRIRAAVDARRSESVILARCDVLSAGQSWEQALERSVAYCEAGADMTFVPRMRVEDAAQLAAATRKPVAASGTEGARYIPPPELERLNVKVAIYAAQFPNLALGAVDEAFRELQATGTISNYAQRAIAPETYARLIDTETSVAIAKKYNANRP